MENAEYLDYDVKYPTILSRGDWITKLIVRHYHERGHHISEINHTSAQLAQRYWIKRGREEARECENQYYDCRQRKPKVANQIMALLSSARLKKPLHDFAGIAADYAGPFITIQGTGRKRSKRYLCLFTFLLSRAVHLEIAYGSETQ